MTIDKKEALGSAYTLLGFLQAKNNEFDFEDSIEYKLISKIIEFLKGD